MLQPTSDQTWARVLTKGLITLPKPYRRDLGLKDGQLVKIKKVGRSLVIEPDYRVDYELYSDAELAQMLRADVLPPRFAKKAASYWADIK